MSENSEAKFRLAKRYLKKIQRWTLRLTKATAGLLLLTAFIVWFYRVEILTKVLKTVFWADLTLQDASVDPFSHFPETTVRLTNLVVYSTNPKRPGKVLTVKSGEFRANLYELLTNKTRKHISRIAVDSCFLDQHVDSSFVRNYQFFKRPDSLGVKKNPPKEVAIDEIYATNFRVADRFPMRGRSYFYRFDTARLSLNVFPDTIQVVGKLTGATEAMNLGNYPLLENRKIKIDLATKINKKEKMYYFQRAMFSIDGVEIYMKGKLRGGNYAFYDLKFDAPKGNINTLLSFVPRKAGDLLDKFQARARLTLSGKIQGEDNDEVNPYLEINFDCEDGAIRNRANGAALSAFKAKGSYNNGAKHSIATTSLAVEEVSGRIGDSPFKVKLKLTNFDDLNIDGNLKTAMHFGDLAKFLNLTKVDSAATGFARLELEGRGRLANFIDREHVDETYFSGFVEMKDIGYDLPEAGVDFSDINGRVNFSGEDIRVDSFSMRINQQEIKVDGFLSGFVPYLAGESERLTGKMDVRSKQFDMANFMKIILRTKSERLERQRSREEKRLQKQKSKEKAAKKNQKSKTKDKDKEKDRSKEKSKFDFDFDLPKNTDLELNLDIDKLIIGKAHFQQAEAHVSLIDKRLKLSNFALQQGAHRLLVNMLLDASSDKRNYLKTDFNFYVADTKTLLGDLGVKPKKAKVDSTDISLALSGLYHFDGYIEKNLPDSIRPRASFHSFFHQGEIRTSDGKIQLSKFTFRTKMNEDWLFRPKKAALVIDSISGRINQYPFWANLSIDNLTDKNVSMYLSTDIAVEEFLKYFTVDWVTEPRGQANFDVLLKGKLTSFTNPDSLVNLPQRGNLNLQGVGFKMKKNGLTFADVMANLRFDQSGVYMDNFCGKMDKSDFRLSGKMQNVLNYIYQSDAPLIADVRFESDSIFVPDLLQKQMDAPKSREQKQAQKTTKSAYKFSLPKLSDVKADIRVGYAVFDRIRVDSLQVSATVINQFATLRDFRFNTCGGSIQAYGELSAKEGDSLRLNFNLGLNNLRLESALYALKNLNQAFVTDTTLSGRLNARLKLTDVLPTDLHSDFKRMRVELDFEAREANLHKFQMLKKLHPIINKKYLDEVNFTLAGRNLVYEKSVLYVPDFEIRSSIFNAQIYGYYTQEDWLEFHLTVLLVPRRDRNVMPTLKADLSRRYQTSLLNFKLIGTAKHNNVKFEKGKTLTHVLNWARVRKDRLIEKETIANLLKKRKNKR